MALVDKNGRTLQNFAARKPKIDVALGDKFGSWAGRDLDYWTLPGGAVLQFDLSRLTLADYRAMRDHYQINASLKYEMVLDLTEVRETAIGSSNYHEDHFGHGFDLHLADGTPAHSACIGFGLDRITLALFATHGMDLEAWPGEVRSALHC